MFFLFYFLLLTITLQAMGNSNCTSEASWIWKTKHLCFPSSKKRKTPKHSLWPACATAWSAKPWSVLHPSTVPGAAAHPGARQQEQPCLWPLQQQKPSAAGRAADNLLNVGLYIHSSWAQVSECRGLSSVKEAVNDSCGDGRLSVPPRLPVVCLYFQAEEQRFAVIRK